MVRGFQVQHVGVHFRLDQVARVATNARRELPQRAQILACVCAARLRSLSSSAKRTSDSGSGAGTALAAPPGGEDLFDDIARQLYAIAARADRPLTPSRSPAPPLPNRRAAQRLRSTRRCTRSID